MTRATNAFGITRTSSVVFIDAHPGSHIRACAGAMLLARRLGAKIAVVEACDGAAMVDKESEGPAMAVRRRKEIRSAMNILGLPPESLYLLGFPDGGLEPLRHDYWRATGRPYFCPWLKADRVASPDAWRGGLEFFGERFFALLKDLLAQTRPTHVFAHHCRDTHMDHRAVNWFVKKALGNLHADRHLRQLPTLFEWITYYTRLPWPPAGSDIPLAAAARLPFPGRIVRYVPPAVDRKAKVKAWKEFLPSHGARYVKRWTRKAEVFWVQ